MFKKEPDTRIIIEQHIFKEKGDEENRTVEARLEIQKEPSEHPGEEDKFNYGLFIDVDPDRKDNMTVDVHGHVNGGDMDVTTHAATEGVGKADVHAEIHYGDDEDQDSVEMSVFDTSASNPVPRNFYSQILTPSIFLPLLGEKYLGYFVLLYYQISAQALRSDQ